MYRMLVQIVKQQYLFIIHDMAYSGQKNQICVSLILLDDD